MAGVCTGPGPCDTSPVGTPGGRQNWVDKAGGLDPYIRAIVHALRRKDPELSESEAIQRAWGIARNWAQGKGGVTAETRARAAKAVANMDRKRAMSLSNDLDGATMQIRAQQIIDLATGPVDLAAPTAGQMRTLVKQGKAMPGPAGPRFPIRNHDDVRKAVRAVGRAKGDHAAVRRFIRRRAKALGASHLIPDNWTTSGASA